VQSATSFSWQEEHPGSPVFFDLSSNEQECISNSAFLSKNSLTPKVNITIATRIIEKINNFKNITKNIYKLINHSPVLTGCFKMTGSETKD